MDVKGVYLDLIMGLPEQQFAFQKNVPIALPETQKSSDIDMVHAGEWTVSIPLAVGIDDHKITHEVLLASDPTFSKTAEETLSILAGADIPLSVVIRPEPPIIIANATRESRGRRNRKTGNMVRKTLIVG